MNEKFTEDHINDMKLNLALFGGYKSKIGGLKGPTQICNSHPSCFMIWINKCLLKRDYIKPDDSIIKTIPKEWCPKYKDESIEVLMKAQIYFLFRQCELRANE